MSFHRRAWYAAAEEHGRRNAVPYARLARLLAVLGWVVGIALAIGIVVAAHGGFGG